MKNYLLAIDQGTTSTRAIIFDDKTKVIAQHQVELTQYFPDDGWVEHDALQILQDTITVCQSALDKAQLNASDICGIGISNQRETTVVWNTETGQPIHKAIVWQDRRTADSCQALIEQDLEHVIAMKTGLLLDPYFSATKVQWLLDNVKGARQLAAAGKLAFGTIDCFLIWHLTNGKRHVTDVTNASRTLLYNIHRLQWDEELLKLFNIPASMLPEVCESSADFGTVDSQYFGAEIAIAGVAGDQQAALIGQACFETGMVKCTYGTGCFLMQNIGDNLVQSKNRLLTTVAYQIQGKTSYAIEGSIFVAGATVQWLRDALHLISHAKETEQLAIDAVDNGGVYLVPAFTGLGAPYWDPMARGAILGLTRASGVAQIVRASLEAVCYQTRDILEAMISDGAQPPSQLRVDGGMVENDWLVKFLADVLNVPVGRAAVTETSALGVAFLAGLQVGLYPSLQHISALWQQQQLFQPTMKHAVREQLYRGWNDAVQRIKTSS